MTEDVIDQASRDAHRLAATIDPDDYASLVRCWQRKSFYPIASLLRRYGIEFRGVTHLEFLVEELVKIKEEKQ